MELLYELCQRVGILNGIDMQRISSRLFYAKDEAFEFAVVIDSAHAKTCL